MTLLFALLLLIGAGILAFGAGRTGVVEQRIANNEQQGIEAEEAAEAGLDYALAWLSDNVWTPDVAPPTPPVHRSVKGELYDTGLRLTPAPNAICVRSRAVSREDAHLTATVYACFAQGGLFAPSPAVTMPPALMIGGCWTAPPGTAELYVPGADALSIVSGESAGIACLPQGALEVSTWRDSDGDRRLAPSEKGPSAEYRRARIDGCPGAHCTWNQVFDLPFDEATALAENAGHVFTDQIPCGATSAPGIYLIQHDGPIDRLDLSGGCVDEDGDARYAIGTPAKPILLIVPGTGGCPIFADDIEIQGIVYFEQPCAGTSWQDASIQGAVIWEGDAAPPGDQAVFIETDYGSGSELNAAFQVVTGAARVPGTWRDWE